MLAKKMTYKDYDGNVRTETFYFNLSEAEILEMELMTTGGMQTLLQRIVDAKDQRRIVETFKAIILKAYGEKSDDGRRLIKSPEISKAFTETPAYNMLFMELSTDADAASKFVNAIIPEIKEDKKTLTVGAQTV